MQTLVAVGKDLFYFVFSEQFGLQDQRQKAVTEYTAAVASAARKIPLEEDPLATTSFAGSDKLYIAVPETPLLLFPTYSIDGVKHEFQYAAEVIYHEHKGRFAKVSAGDLTGWVNENALVTQRSVVMPNLKSGDVYTDVHSDTISIRTVIDDEFHTVAMNTELQDVEYVTYRHRLRGVEIPWTAQRPRVAGSWQRLLKGRPGVHVGVMPKTDSIFEIISEDGLGEVAYVDAVYPDQSIKISRVGTIEPGMFTEDTLPLAVWRELQPVFISVA